MGRGFDAFVGNPPFLGGKRVTTVLGEAYRDWLKETHEEGSSNADLADVLLSRRVRPPERWRLDGPRHDQYDRARRHARRGAPVHPEAWRSDLRCDAKMPLAGQRVGRGQCGALEAFSAFGAQSAPRRAAGRARLGVLVGARRRRGSGEAPRERVEGLHRLLLARDGLHLRRRERSRDEARRSRSLDSRSPAERGSHLCLSRRRGDQRLSRADADPQGHPLRSALARRGKAVSGALRNRRGQGAEGARGARELCRGPLAEEALVALRKRQARALFGHARPLADDRYRARTAARSRSRSCRRRLSLPTSSCSSPSKKTARSRCCNRACTSFGCAASLHRSAMVSDTHPPTASRPSLSRADSARRRSSRRSAALTTT